MEIVGEYEYNTKDLIGHGAFAVVFKGRQRKNHSLVVAIKSITKKNLSKSQNLLGKEIKILKELTELHHENVVALLDCKETSLQVYLVMEYCNGGDLADYLHVKGTLSEDTIRLFLRQLAGAMKALNAKGIVHRDLKPQNILLCHSGKPNPAPHDILLKIADFGFARFLQDGVMAATLCGSPMYMAPEVIMSLQYDAKADLWSIGTIVFQCLTGKAPFQAQTPQALKLFYEKNVQLAPKIPMGTSADLSNLLLCLLKRNAKDRLEFDDFFVHPFLNKAMKPSSPVPVPSRQHSIVPLPSAPPHESLHICKQQQHSPSSPLSAVAAKTSPTKINDNALPVEELAAVPSSVSPFEPGQYSPISKVLGSTSSSIDEQEDFVLVSGNLESDNSCDSAGVLGGKRKSAEAYGTSPMTIGTPPSKMNVGMTAAESPSLLGRNPPPPSSSPHGSSASPSSPRPSYLPVAAGSPGGTGAAAGGRSGAAAAAAVVPCMSEPIPVPTQKEAYQQIQQSLRESPGSPCQPPGSGRERHLSSSSLGSSPRSPSRPMSADGQQPSAVPRSQPITMRKDSTESLNRVPDISSLSPPSVQFVIGTPPGVSRCHSSGTPPPPSPWPCVPPPYSPGRQTPGGSPLRKSGVNSSPVNANYFFSGSPLLPIMASPSNQQPPPALMNYNTLFPNLHPDGHSSHSITSPSQPLVVPFGVRARTLPDISSRDVSLCGSSSAMDTTSCEALMPRSGSMGRLGDAAFVGFQSNLGVSQGVPAASESPPSGHLLPYGRQPALLFGHDGGRHHHHHQWHFGNMPPTMEGPVLFVAPELPEETLMEREHNETLAKLNFVLALVDCIVDLAKARSTPIAALTESMVRKENNSTEQLPVVSESYRRAEQFVLYVRALQMLSSSLNLSKEELRNGRLQPSNSVKSVVTMLNERYHHCLHMCKVLNGQNLLQAATRNDLRTSNITADKLLYNYAIEMCQSAALDELFGNPRECFHRYQIAQLLLHSLAQQISNDDDRGLLCRYKEAVEKRLYVLQQQGYVYAYDTTST